MVTISGEQPSRRVFTSPQARSPTDPSNNPHRYATATASSSPSPSTSGGPSQTRSAMSVPSRSRVAEVNSDRLLAPVPSSYSRAIRLSRKYRSTRSRLDGVPCGPLFESCSWVLMSCAFTRRRTCVACPAPPTTKYLSSNEAKQPSGWLRKGDRVRRSDSIACDELRHPSTPKLAPMRYRHGRWVRPACRGCYSSQLPGPLWQQQM